MSATVTVIACARKKRYATEGAALAVIFAMRARGSDLADRLEVQPCAGCSGYHLRGKPLPPRPTILPFDPTTRRGRRPSLPYEDDD
jgi:hypothetical protein